MQAPLLDEAGVNRAQAPGEWAVGRHSQRHGLAVHGAAGAHHEVTRSDEARPINGLLGHHEPARGQGLALVLRARQHDGLHAVALSLQAVHHLCEHIR